ncbi:MAG TPA: tetratricopeptide repeat protein, partial [Opitutus sp.]|nr:tetratricopeptide repeat protein [Opitutus sp.]
MVRAFKPTANAAAMLSWRGRLWFAFGMALIVVAGCRRAETSLDLPARPGAEVSALLRARLDDAEAQVRAAPGAAERWRRLAAVYHANGFAGEAIACYRHAIECAGDNATTGELHYLLAVAAEEAGDVETAETALRETLKRIPNAVPALLRAGDLRYKAGDADAAMVFYRAASAIDVNNPEALLALAREALRKEDDAIALELLDRLERAHPGHGSGLSLKAQLMERRGEYSQADAIRRQRRVRKDRPMRDPLLDEVMLACVDVPRLGLRFEDELNAGRIDDALATLDRMQAIEPGNWLTYRLRGFALAHSGRPEAAVEAYRKAIEFGGDPAVVYPGLVSVLVKLERFDEAAQFAREGLAKAPG